MNRQLFVYVGKKGIFGVSEQLNEGQPAALRDIQHLSWRKNGDVFTVKEGTFRWNERTNRFVVIKHA